MSRYRAKRSRCSLLAVAAVAATAIAAPSAIAATQTVVSGPSGGTLDNDMTAYFQRFNDQRSYASVIADPHPVWGTIAGAKYVNVTGVQNQEWGNFVYTKKLELPAGAINATVDVQYYADDCATFSANNPTSNFAVDPTKACNTGIGQFYNWDAPWTASGPLRAGTNTLRFDVTNAGGWNNPSGLVFKAVATYDMDTDGDGILDDADNCPNDLNADQKNQDRYANSASEDTLGDVCDADRDGDGVANTSDKFPDNINESADSDNDGVGDNADAFPKDSSESQDTDNDKIGDNLDNCVNDANVAQTDTDGDTLGDACDPDIDDDGVLNEADAFPTDKTESVDTDGDGLGNNSDPYPTVDARTDADNDGVGDAADNCPSTSNNNQLDSDGDKLGDVCDSDRDGDGVPNSTDNAPDNANANQNDLDRDGLADVLDTTVLPLSGDACKKNGWTSYYDGTRKFKNQGDCVSYVATKNRNLMAG